MAGFNAGYPQGFGATLTPMMPVSSPLALQTASPFNFGAPGGGFVSSDYARGAMPNIDPATAGGGLFGIDGLGANLQTLGLGLSGLQTIGGLWGALQASKVAKQQLHLARDTTNINLANQTQSYNTTLADRARARASFTGESSAAVDDYIAKNSLPTKRV